MPPSSRRTAVDWLTGSLVAVAIGCGAACGSRAPAPAPASAAPAPAPPPAAPPPSDWEPVPCDEVTETLYGNYKIGSFNAFRDFDPVARGLDYLGIAEPYPRLLPDIARAWRIDNMPAFPSDHVAGTACAKATDLAACQAKVRELEISAGKYSSPTVVSTAGDKAGSFWSTATLATLLAPIDTPREALALARLHGFGVACAVSPEAGRGTEVRRDSNADGFWVRISGGHGDQLCTRNSLHVHADGRIAHVDHTRVDAPSCGGVY